MKIGIFDSGLGGLIIAKAIRKVMPEYDYVYLGDTKRVPYGNRSHEAIYEFTREAVDYLFKKEDCAIIIIACNTASARALRRIQQEYLVEYNATRRLMGDYERKILGVLIPAAEEAARYKRVGILGTLGTVNSNSFPNEIQKINLEKKKKLEKNNYLSFFQHTQHCISKPYSGSSAGCEKGANTYFLDEIENDTKVFQNSAPLLVPLIEEGEKVLAVQFIKKYLKTLQVKKLDALVLGCTHYPFYKKEIKKILGSKIKVISQDEIVPKKLKDYFVNYPEIEKKLSKNKKAKILVTDITPNIKKLSQKWFGKNTELELIEF
ncbi:MAG: Glutamate racemase [Candidatus Nomurabacteria bacterium GW2011_GWE1_32_28]|uniref:Glutamate racemase n=1 Tax=Candidatus Nomurabacteria bacterium GW2011_GWF1_31_48 TaxID=1618767 RepID=A0A0F9YG36_9BACT|nr:MAG: Glutamate racemase [Candidatus Nomurabacteria bacterium GW2011_GWF2_30_133]KKP28815.1 MAG: Glutamate racemase [Candidatus Nomurabacteria bacterium GW2011_GWE2_31_40]KKP30393.1 MAG: Glutamate racemase [Candidatus Nomurabacteria bacterium GW2011_GWF1_31_48]KKP34920.1 MAG: Glutamate racemase [Candidatus Nomurabacteria bacterium GW2011_GWE1_32_28]HAS81011.1 glutamate racemase [Candidatus Nomurabacteria bacterium]